ncbi:hypothetical protein BU17DRAFT_69922 [Hysterangium stoloniferum]|nr:hypothetical protein BU17DRAFT_69922 [Hysterangium stoloniferum]
MILIDLNNIPTTSTPATATATASARPLPICNHMLDATWNTIQSEMSEFVIEYIKEPGPAKNLEEHSDRKDGYAKNLKHHSKRSAKLAQILRRHPERSIKLAQTLREHSEKNTNCAKNLEEHSGRNELTKHIEQHSKRNAQLANDVEKRLGNAKLTKNFDGSSGWLRRLFAQELSILDQQMISVEYIYEATAEGKSSLPGRIASVVDTKESVEEESRNADEIRVVIRQAIKGTLQKMERPRSSLVGDSEDS